MRSRNCKFKYRAGAIGIDKKNNDALGRLRQCNGPNEKWKYLVLFEFDFGTNSPDIELVRASEKVLHGSLCWISKHIAESEFCLRNGKTADESAKIICNTAIKTIKKFLKHRNFKGGKLIIKCGKCTQTCQPCRACGVWDEAECSTDCNAHNLLTACATVETP